MKNLKNLCQIAGIGSIAWALYAAWHALPLKDAIVGSLATLATTDGPTGEVQIVALARSLPATLFSSPWLLVGITLVLIPYLVDTLSRALPQPQPRRY